MNTQLGLENELVTIPKPPKQTKKFEFSEEAKFQMMFRAQMREFEENLIHKLPNEFRHTFKGYNFRADNDFFIDKNNYIYF
jgi:hypothetical protein